VLLSELGFQSRWASGGPLRRLLSGSAHAAYQRLARPFLPDRARQRVRKAFARPPFDPEGTIAYGAGPFLSARLNVIGREAHGCVPPSDCDHVRTEIVAALNEVVNPFSGEKDLGVFAADDYYSGPHTHLGPDILGAPQQFALERAVSPTDDAKAFLTHQELRPGAEMRYREGTHRLDGIFACKLPSGPTSLRIALPELADIVPTVLALLSLPLPAHLEGRVALDLPEQPTSVSEQTWEPTRSEGREGYSDQERKKIEQRLRDLGYL